MCTYLTHSELTIHYGRTNLCSCKFANCFANNTEVGLIPMIPISGVVSRDLPMAEDSPISLL